MKGLKAKQPLKQMVMFNIGTGIWDATCTLFGAPHLIVGAAVQSSERFFSSGNERTTTFFNPPVSLTSFCALRKWLR